MEQVTKVLGENLYGFWGVKATLGVWIGFLGFLVMLLHNMRTRNK